MHGSGSSIRTVLAQSVGGILNWMSGSGAPADNESSDDGDSDRDDNDGNEDGAEQEQAVEHEDRSGDAEAS